jgi:hypothetical protein
MNLCRRRVRLLVKEDITELPAIYDLAALGTPVEVVVLARVIRCGDRASV